MARVNAQQYAEKWARRLKGSTTDIRTGVENVSVAPGKKAAENAEKMLEGVRRAIENGTWQRSVESVSLDDWKRATIDKGINRIAAGVDSAQTKQVDMAEKLLAAVDRVKSSVDNMPDATLEDRLQRMVAFARGMSEQRIK